MKILKLLADDCSPSTVEQFFARLNIPVPGSQLRPRESKIQPFSLCSQFDFSFSSPGHIRCNSQKTGECVVAISDSGHGERYCQSRTIFTNVGPFASVVSSLPGVFHKRVEALDVAPRLPRQLFAAGLDLRFQVNQARRLKSHHLLSGIPQHLLCTRIEESDRSLQVGGDDRNLSRSVNDGLKLSLNALSRITFQPLVSDIGHESVP